MAATPASTPIPPLPHTTYTTHTTFPPFVSGTCPLQVCPEPRAARCRPIFHDRGCCAHPNSFQTVHHPLTYPPTSLSMYLSPSDVLLDAYLVLLIAVATPAPAHILSCPSPPIHPHFLCHYPFVTSPTEPAGLIRDSCTSSFQVRPAARAARCRPSLIE